MDKFIFLQFLDIFSGLFTRLGVDYPIMRKILGLRLTLDNRAVALINSQNPSKSRSRNNYNKSLIIYGLIGATNLIFLFTDWTFYIKMNLVFASNIFFLIFVMMSDYSRVILDSSDKNIIMTKPVDERTYNTAKVLHIAYYILGISLALNIGSILFGTRTYGLGFFFTYLLAIIFIDILVISLTSGLYYLILKYYSGNKLREVINGFQIAFIVFISLGYQLIFRLIDLSQVASDFSHKLYHYLIPSLWFSSFFELIVAGSREKYVVISFFLGILIPSTLFIIYVKTSKKFEENLYKLTEVAKESQEFKVRDGFVEKILTPRPQDRVYFKFTRAIIKSDRDFKLKAYPSLGFAIAFPLIMGLSGNNLREIPYYNIYFSGIYMSNLIYILAKSNSYKGHWIFKLANRDNSQAYRLEAGKVVLTYLISPIFLVLSIIMTYLLGPSYIPAFITAYLGICLNLGIGIKVILKDDPFSQALDTNNKMDIGKAISLMVILLFQGIFHNLIRKYLRYGDYIVGFIFLVLNLLVWKKRED